MTEIIDSNRPSSASPPAGVELDPARPTENTEQLRITIDRGHGGDKVDAPDPAAAPLGTDDEAGGNSQGSEPGPIGGGSRDSSATSAIEAKGRGLGPLGGSSALLCSWASRSSSSGPGFPLAARCNAAPPGYDFSINPHPHPLG